MRAMNTLYMWKAESVDVVVYEGEEQVMNFAGMLETCEESAQCPGMLWQIGSPRLLEEELLWQ